MSVTSLNGLQNVVTAVSLNAGISITTAGQELNFNALSGGVTSVIADGQSTAGDITLVGGGSTTITNDGNNTITITSTGSDGTSIGNGTVPDRGEISIDTTGNIYYNNKSAQNANQSFEAGNNFQVIAGGTAGLSGSVVELLDTGAGISIIPTLAGGLSIAQPSGGTLTMSGVGGNVSLLGAGGGGLTVPSEAINPLTLNTSTGQYMTLIATDNTHTSSLKLGDLDGLGLAQLGSSQQMTVSSAVRVDISSPQIVLGPISGTAITEIQLNGAVTIISDGAFTATASGSISLTLEGATSADDTSLKLLPASAYTPNPSADIGLVITRNGLYFNGQQITVP
jgi:hypothetical protein